MLQRLVLEVSLKPFYDLRPEALAERWRAILKAWAPMIERSRQLAVLLWVSDGSDVLDWRGRLADEIPGPWGVGFYNLEKGCYPNKWYGIWQVRPYREHPPRVTYEDLRRIIATLRSAARELTGQTVAVGATVDPGPEFSEATFKYVRHREILTESEWGRQLQMHFMSAHGRLKADAEAYGGFPGGIPAGTGLGTFLGKQFASVAAAVGFDYLWLSNGLGYTHYPWIPFGEVFHDGALHPGAAAEERDQTNRFWAELRQAVGDRPIEVRGTNFSVGMDLATDGTSHVDILRIGRPRAMPCNIPVGGSAPGFEVSGYLSRLAGAPEKGPISWRFYLNDPWFSTNPWYDAYDREPYDIYIPMACARLNEAGRVDPPTDLHLLTIDQETGEVSAEEALEFAPYAIRAVREQPDAVGPIVWVYPFEEFDDLLKHRPEDLGAVLFNDNFVRYAMENGLPVNTVCRGRTVERLAHAGTAPETIWLAPTPRGDWGYARALLAVANAGGNVFFYGPLDQVSPELRAALGVELAAGLEGEFEVESSLGTDVFDVPAEPRRILRHRALVSGGGIRETARDALVTVRQDGQQRAYALCRPVGRGTVAWLRGTVGVEVTANQWKRDGAEVVCAEEMARHMLACFGWRIVMRRPDATAEPVRVFLKRHEGGWFLTGVKLDTRVNLRMGTPEGAPLYTNHVTPLTDGLGGETFGRTIYCEVRVFVRQGEGVAEARERPVPPGWKRSLAISGLNEADVTVYPDPAALAAGRLIALPYADADQWEGEGSEKRVAFEVDRERGTMRFRRHTGNLFVRW